MPHIAGVVHLRGMLKDGFGKGRCLGAIEVFFPHGVFVFGESEMQYFILPGHDRPQALGEQVDELVALLPERFRVISLLEEGFFHSLKIDSLPAIAKNSR